MDLEPFVQAGLYEPGAAGAAERAELLEHLLGRGFAVEAIVAAAEEVGPTHVAARLSRPWSPSLSVREVADATGVTVEQLTRMRLALGFPVADVDVRSLPEFVLQAANLFAFGCVEFGEDATLAFARVLGAAAARIVDASRSMFTESLRAAEATELEISQRNEALNGVWTAVYDVLGSLLRERASTDYDLFARMLNADAPVAVSFIDLADSTAWTARQEPSVVRSALSTFERLAHEVAALNGVRVVKFIGDEAMLVGADPPSVCRAAVGLVASVTQHSDLPPARGAVSAGAVTARDGDFFGAVVNLTSRITKLTTPGTVVVT